ncbi:MAG: hypothetical protein IJ239_05005, partial [Eubacterium sp.]|nr:hypothetical protein [Eubacterium sp.]
SPKENICQLVAGKVAAIFMYIPLDFYDKILYNTNGKVYILRRFAVNYIEYLEILQKKIWYIQYGIAQSTRRFRPCDQQKQFDTQAQGTAPPDRRGT